jgi:UDP:flavonoid glycosyltransferase YjiC (YdhE family)
MGACGGSAAERDCRAGLSVWSALAWDALLAGAAVQTLKQFDRLRLRGWYYLPMVRGSGEACSAAAAVGASAALVSDFVWWARWHDLMSSQGLGELLASVVLVLVAAGDLTALLRGRRWFGKARKLWALLAALTLNSAVLASPVAPLAAAVFTAVLVHALAFGEGDASGMFEHVPHRHLDFMGLSGIAPPGESAAAVAASLTATAACSVPAASLLGDGLGSPKRAAGGAKSPPPPLPAAARHHAQQLKQSSDGKVRVVVLTMGSRGDVQPFVALGQALKRSGRATTTIVTMARYQPLVEQYGIEFRSCGLVDLDLNSRIWRDATHVSEVISEARQQVSRQFRAVAERFWAACQGCDVIISTSVTGGFGLSIGEALGVPCWVVKLSPDSPTREFSPPSHRSSRIGVVNLWRWYHYWVKVGLAARRGSGLSGGGGGGGGTIDGGSEEGEGGGASMSTSARSSSSSGVGGGVTTASSSTVGGACSADDAIAARGTAGPPSSDPETAFRTEVLGLTALAGGKRLAQLKYGPQLCAFSQALVAKPRDWPVNVAVTGFWLVQESERPLLTRDRTFDDLLPFLAARDSEPRPVVVTFGSMSEVAKGFGVLAKVLMGIAAVTEPGLAGRRTKVVLVDPDLVEGELEGYARDQRTAFGREVLDIRTVKEVPHRLLLPRCSLLVHHGGAGTTAAALQFGLPAIIVPIMLWTDQPLWADRVEALGAGLHVERKSPTLQQDISKAYLQITSDGGRIVAAAKALGDKMMAQEGEDCAAKAASMILAPFFC